MSDKDKISEAYSKIKDMPRSKIRYRLYCLRNNVDVNLDDGIKVYYESQPEFSGWSYFAIRWDIGKSEGPEKFRIVKRLLSEYEEWDAIVRQHAI
jgi:hypothetical protein